MLGDIEEHVAATDLETDYEILGELGRGATAVVYRARDRELGREVAIKVIRPKYADDDETVARLAREARTVAQLQHPNIVTLYAIRRVRDGGLALVMQYVPGRTLREALNERGALTFERADRVLRDVAAALAHAHKRGIVHRDVKPENIFIDESTGHALLSDFGVARSLEPDSQLTATGTAIGTPSYMSPEQIDGSQLDGRSDLYSLGLVGWEMLTGRRPWDGEGLYSVIYKQKREELQPIDEIRPDTPDRLIYLVEGATRKSAADRWAGAEQFLEHASTIAPDGGWSRWHAERRKRRRAGVYAAARERGDSVVSAALETVRFRRDAIPSQAERADATRDSVGGAAGVGGAAAIATSLSHEGAFEPRRVGGTDFVDEFGGPVRRRSLVPVVGVAAVVLATIVGGAYLIRGRTQPASGAPSEATFADNGGVEVPVTAPVVPNAGGLPGTREPAAPESAAPAAAAGGTQAEASPEARAAVSRIAADSTGSVNDAARARAAPPPSEQVAARPAAPADVPPTPVPAPPITRATPEVGPLPPRPSAAVPSPVPSPITTPVTSAPVSTPVSFPAERGIVAPGGRHTCALDESGTAQCWGANDQGQLGDGTRDDHSGPAVVAGGLAFAQVSAGASHTCGVTRDGDVYCWGTNERGQLGDATTLQRDTPVRVGATGPFKVVRAGFAHSCALARSGELSCWGSNAYGQLGTGGGLTSPRAAAVAGGLAFGAVAVGWNHTCGITTAGELHCWGSNNAGQLGDGSRDDRRTPVKAIATARFVSVAAGNQHTCAVATSGDVYCWGRNNFGQLGTGPGDRSVPSRVDIAGDFALVAAGAVHSCARTTAGQLYCWGRNTFGQLGDGSNVDRPSPARVVGLPGVAVVQASGAHTCAATSGGESYCWGYNVEGQLGDGTRTHRSRPVRVSPAAR